MKARSRTALALVTGLAALTACGTTVPQREISSQGPLGQGLEPGSSSTSGQVQPGTSTGTGSGGVLPGSGTSTGTGGTGTGSATGGTGTGPAPTSSRAPLVPGGRPLGPAGTAPGVTATTIKIGVFTAQGFGDFAASAGFNVATGDQTAEAKAIINHINAHGGIAGRKVIPVFHDLNVAGAASNIESEYAQACAAWTQDERVYAVVSPVGTVSNGLYDCLSKKGVPTVAAGDSQDASFLQKYGLYYYQPADMNLRRILSNSVDALFAAGFFGAKPKIGVILVDNPNEKAAVQQGLVPALKRHGLALTDSFAAPNGTNGASSYSSAVLRFQTKGITHVLFSYLGSALLFMQNAENQKYYPRYGLHSRQSPATVLQTNAPKSQQKNAMGIGWQPMNDVDQAHDPGSLGARQQLCLKLLKESGQDTSGRVAALLGLWMCDNFLFLQDALAKAPDFTLAGLKAGAESLGSFPVASTFRSTFGPGRLHDGAGAFRLLAFKDDCGCYQYVSPLHAAS